MMGVGTDMQRKQAKMGKNHFSMKPPPKAFVVKLTQVEDHLTCHLCPLLSSPDERMTADGTDR